MDENRERQFNSLVQHKNVSVERQIPLKTVFTLTDKNGKTETVTAYSDVKSVG